MPATKNVLISVESGRAVLVTTDLETTIAATCVAESSGWPFQLVLPYQYLLQIIAHAEAMPVQIQHPSARVARITAGSDVYEQKGLEKPEDFPKVPEMPKAKGVEFGEDFLRSLTHAKASISKDELKPPMTRACLDITSDNIHLAATDALIMYVQEISVEGSQKLKPDQLLLSPKLAEILKGQTKLSISHDKRMIIAQAEGLTVWMKCVEGKYPAYRNVIPEKQPNLFVNRKELISALEKASINANAMLRAKIELSNPDLLIIEMDNEDQACKNRIQVAGKYAGSAPFVVVNAAKLITVLNQVETEAVELHIAAPNLAVLVTAEEEPGFLGLIMPLIVD